MGASRGRSPIGKFVVYIVPHIRSRNIFKCCAVNINGVIYYNTKNTSFNSTAFLLFLENLMNVLRERGVSNVVFILDNVPFHKFEAVQIFLRNPNIDFIFLAPYSPFLNPIEEMFSKWKDNVKRGNPVDDNSLMSLKIHGYKLISGEYTEGYYRNMMRYILRLPNQEELND